MKKIALILVAYNSDIDMLHQALSCADLFDEVILHINDSLTQRRVQEGFTFTPKVRVIYRENRMTPQDAFNDAISQSTSEWILPMTDDDFFHRENLKYLLNHSMSEDVDIIHYPIFAGKDGGEWVKWGDNPIITFQTLWENNLIPFSSVYKKRVFDIIAGYQNVPFSDWLFWLKCVQKKFNFYYLDNPVYYHRQEHKHSLANSELKKFGLKKIKLMFKKELSYEKN